MPGEIWSNQEIDKLIRVYKDNRTSELVNIFHRSETSIVTKARRLGLSKNRQVTTRQL
jgi:fibronectin type 3 domain-containing protein